MTKTVRVRVAVALASADNWCASGWRGGSDENMMNDAIGMLDAQQPSLATYWLEADLLIPEPQVIEAEVKPT